MNALPTAEMGWCECPNCCCGAFLSVVGARVRCPACGHVFTVETVTIAKPGRFDESKPSGKQWLLRIEIRIARAWAEALFNQPVGVGITSDCRDWDRAWQQVRALRFGQRIEFSYPPVAGSGLMNKPGEGKS